MYMDLKHLLGYFYLLLLGQEDGYYPGSQEAEANRNCLYQS